MVLMPRTGQPALWLYQTWSDALSSRTGLNLFQVGNCRHGLMPWQDRANSVCGYTRHGLMPWQDRGNLFVVISEDMVCDGN
ncbi:hypothetical protein AVEN_68707-1 [Araneus ventricosus]|uniref:Uncharacterized protein n=1 Tax=Araneus ventricosus TaxID=182803 RepID=A0A4Y2L1E2_ARAVE|nr:hypothetical protein AVEN_68707-1 [Araneus ventricosus]